LKPDFGVIGEGEETIIELLTKLKTGGKTTQVNGIICKNENNETIITKSRKLIEDLDLLPFPDFNGIGFNESLENASAYGLFDYPRIYPILCSRGCPFQCTFCYHCLGIKYRIRSIEGILKELKVAIKKYKINSIMIYDDLFSFDKQRLYDFCKRIKKLIKEVSWEIRWDCQISVQNVDKEMLRILKDSGCYEVSYGFESYSSIVLKSMKKPITPQQIDNAIKLTLESGLSIRGGFIFGDTAETKETAYETLNYWKKNCRGLIGLNFIQPYPGSEIYNNCVKKGIIKDKLDFIKNHISHINWLNLTNNMSDGEILKLKEDILDARRRHCKYTIPLSIHEDRKNKNRYNILIKCPQCNKKILYRNCFINNRIHYFIGMCCKNCFNRISISSKLYKFGMLHYQGLDFLRRNYLLIRDNFLKKRL
ncbi:MAG: radical SAM protein, partial [Nanoarchaeota archaeon]